MSVRLEMVPGDDDGLVCEDGVCAVPASGQGNPQLEASDDEGDPARAERR